MDKEFYSYIHAAYWWLSPHNYCLKNL